MEVDPNIFLKGHKYPKDELMMNPYLRSVFNFPKFLVNIFFRFPIYHRLPLLYRLQMEEEIVSYDNIVNHDGYKRPQEDGEWVDWQPWTREWKTGRIIKPGHTGKIRRRALFHSNRGCLGNVVDKYRYQSIDETKPVRVNREYIPYEFPQGKTDKRFYHPLKGGRQENIPGRMDASTEDNYARNAFDELWGGEGVIRGHTMKSKLKEQPNGSIVHNVTWWPERFYNFPFHSYILNEVYARYIHLFFYFETSRS